MKFQVGQRVVIVDGPFSFCRAAKKKKKKVTGTIYRNSSRYHYCVKIDRHCLIRKNQHDIWHFKAQNIRAMEPAAAYFWREP